MNHTYPCVPDPDKLIIAMNQSGPYSEFQKYDLIEVVNQLCIITRNYPKTLRSLLEKAYLSKKYVIKHDMCNYRMRSMVKKQQVICEGIDVKTYGINVNGVML